MEFEKQSLESYLQSYSTIATEIPDTGPRRGITGVAPNPEGCFSPKIIRPWPDFNKIQDQLFTLITSIFHGRPFPCQNHVSACAEELLPVDCEDAVKSFDTDVLYKPARRILEASLADERVRASLAGFFNISDSSLKSGSFVWSSRSNKTKLSVRLSPRKSVLCSTCIDKNSHRTPTRGKRKRNEPADSREKLGKLRFGSADILCLYQQDEHPARVASATIAKAPRKLTLDMIDTAFGSSSNGPGNATITLDRLWADYGQVAKSETTSSRFWVAATITQLYQYLIAMDVPFGCISTGQAHIFVQIMRDDPSILGYFVCRRTPVPDDLQGGEKLLKTTPLARIVLFTLMCLAGNSTSPKFAKQVLRSGLFWPTLPHSTPDHTSIPFSGRQDPNHAHPNREPSSVTLEHDSEGKRDINSKRAKGDNSTTTSTMELHERPKPATDAKNPETDLDADAPDTPLSEMSSELEDEPYCSQDCLRRMLNGNSLPDKACPNFSYHRARHPSVAEFRQLVRDQFASKDTGYTPLSIPASVGGVFKAYLPDGHYTFVAKGVEKECVGVLQTEAGVYEALRPLQGVSVPVCLGVVEIDEPHYYDGQSITSFLLLSWAGVPIAEQVPGQRGLMPGRGGLSKDGLVRESLRILGEIHSAGFLHGESHPWSVLIHPSTMAVMMLDFGLAQSRRDIAIRGKRRLFWEDMITERRKEHDGQEQRISPLKDENNGKDIWEAACEEEQQQLILAFTS